MLRFEQRLQQRRRNGLRPLMWLRFLVFPLTLLAGLAGIGVLVLALVVALLLAGQLVMMRRFLNSPTECATWYSGFGVPLFVLGMLASAFALRSIVAGPP